MHTLVMFAAFLLSVAPFFGLALILTALLWAATKLFPGFGEWLTSAMDRMDGVDEEYDRKHNTGYASKSFDQYV